MTGRMGSKTCERCGARMQVVLSAATGNRMVLDPEPSAIGNVLVDGYGRAHVFADHAAAMAARAEDVAARGAIGFTSLPQTSHHATCPPLVEQAKRRREERDARKAAEAEAERLRVGGEQMGLGL